MINPIIIWRSHETITLWDDCMSFPSLMTKVRRNTHITVTYIDENAKPHILKEVDAALSELLQHEIDHLDGVLSIDRALSTKDIISREVYENNIEMFHSQVDYFIQPTIADK